MSSIGYRPEIDGFRALAVIPVILFHLKWAGMRGGYLGVDVFFVISGYLITSIVTHELAAGTFTFRGFWARRIRRIFPALLVMVVTTLAVSSRFVFKGDQSAIGEQTLAVLFSVANLHFRKNIGDYWGADASHSPVLHTWSLSVEEQFYLFFPALIWLVMKFRRRWLPGVILCIAVASLGLFLRETKSHPTIAFYLLRTRAWELATGCLLAVVCRGREKIPTAATSENENILGLAGLAMVIASYFLVTSLDGGLIIPVFGAALVIAFGQTGICRTLLSQRPLVSVGKISYSLYLWHWPVIVFAERFGVTNSHFHSSLLCALMLVLATASYVFIERPTRRRPRVIPLIVAAYPLVWGFAAHLA